MADFRGRIPNIQALANALSADYSHIHAVLRGDTRPGHILAKRIESATDGAIKRWELRPDIWEPPTEGQDAA